jgi:glycosyltransferase involved in cell wall biosynthesis
MPGFYNGLDCFVLASLSETFPITLLEAMACGVPVVATRVGGIPEIVDDGKNGILIPPRSPAALADALQSLMRDKTGRDAMGRRARETVQRGFSHERLSRDLKKFYRSVLSAG